MPPLSPTSAHSSRTPESDRPCVLTLGHSELLWIRLLFLCGPFRSRRGFGWPLPVRAITYPPRVGCVGVKLLIHRIFQRSGIDIDGVLGESRGATALTTMIAEAILIAMRRIDPLSHIGRVVLLAVLGFVIASGTALAHGGTSPTSAERSHVQTSTGRHVEHDQPVTTSPTITSPLEQATHSDEPCSDRQPRGHAGDGCCNVACHAALATPLSSVGSSQASASQYAGSLSDMLVGRSSDRAERPPKQQD